MVYNWFSAAHHVKEATYNSNELPTFEFPINKMEKKILPLNFFYLYKTFRFTHFLILIWCLCQSNNPLGCYLDILGRDVVMNWRIIKEKSFFCRRRRLCIDQDVDWKVIKKKSCYPRSYRDMRMAYSEIRMIRMTQKEEKLIKDCANSFVL